MALSPFYGWSEPDNSSLVKNGAADIRTLGDAIDTSLWNVGFGQAGKNKIINGDFGIWQRGTSATPVSGYGYGADRWRTFSWGTSTSTISQQTFTPGAAPVAGYEGNFFLRLNSTNTSAVLEQAIEDVRTFAGQTVTISFWAKSATSQSISVNVFQNFGSGGSSQVQPLGFTQAITTSWVRYSLTGAISSVSGKTIGASSSLILAFSGAINNALDLWGVQMEYGSKATPFQTASGGSIQGELAACERYFQTIATGYDKLVCSAVAYNSTLLIGTYNYRVTMRTTPTIYQTSGTNYYLWVGNNNNGQFNAITALSVAGDRSVRLDVSSGVTIVQGYAYAIQTNNASTLIALQAEL